MAYTKYSLTPADNNAAPPNGAPEGMLPSAVNDTMRDMMAQIRDVGDGIRGGTYTMTAPVITGGSITGVALSGNTLTNPVITGGSINNTTVGATTRSTGAFTTLASNGATTFTAGTASTSTTTGTAVITGGLGVSGRINAANFDGIVGANTAAAGNFTTLGATGVATFSAGTVLAPALTTTGDTNTGIFFPAADTIAFTVGGGESMRLDSSGNLGLGTSSPATKLDISASNPTTRVKAATTGWAYSLFSNDGGDFYIGRDSSAGGAFGSANSNVVWGVSANSTVFATNNTERMRIDSSGNVGIGVTPGSWSAYKALQVGLNTSLAGNTSGSVALLSSNALFDGSSFKYITTDAASQYQQNTGEHIWRTAASGSAGATLTFSERMRIDSSGNLLVGTTTNAINDSNSVVIVSYNGTVVGQVICNHGTGTGSGERFADFGYAGSSIGSITQSGTTAVLYNLTSDARLKTNIVDAPSGNIDDVKVRSFDWKSDGSHVEYGFIAQELVDVAPYAVHQPSNPEEMMAVDYSKLVPMMIKEIQDLKQRIKTLENK